MVVSVVALVLALGGTAFGLSAKGGDESKVIAKGGGTTVKKFNKGASEGNTVLLAKNNQFAVIGNCDDAGTHTPNGFQFPGTWIGIKNLGANNGYGDTTDDDDADLDKGDGVAFNYEDGGDEGEAILPNGHWIAVEGSIDFDSGDTTQFKTDCRFAGHAEFN
jgi:hypothetical protein